MKNRQHAIAYQREQRKKCCRKKIHWSGRRTKHLLGFFLFYYQKAINKMLGSFNDVTEGNACVLFSTMNKFPVFFILYLFIVRMEKCSNFELSERGKYHCISLSMRDTNEKLQVAEL